uniref:Uncharacterized protein n=1 Tax=Siphoviridae sp. ctGuJ10 TaxID=2825418 RepID=A0A8S5PTC3_9CAUD|nr:MAG TPA: hypothetical protein [Siphoviridae sp. ctGuJ10]
MQMDKQAYLRILVTYNDHTRKIARSGEKD